MVDTAAVGPEMQVAEQVSYWISQDIQNAELTLDGLGKDPVEVSIRMHGNEAQVSFRTDELQTRDLLQGAASHLKELLQSEGLVLSGVSVGGLPALVMLVRANKSRNSLGGSLHRCRLRKSRSRCAGLPLEVRAVAWICLFRNLEIWQHAHQQGVYHPLLKLRQSYESQ